LGIILGHHSWASFLGIVLVVTIKAMLIKEHERKEESHPNRESCQEEE